MKLQYSSYFLETGFSNDFILEWKQCFVNWNKVRNSPPKYHQLAQYIEIFKVIIVNSVSST